MLSSSPWSSGKTLFYVTISLPVVPDSALPESRGLGKQSRWAPSFSPPFIFTRLLLLPEGQPSPCSFFFNVVTREATALCVLHVRGTRLYAAQPMSAAKETSSKAMKSQHLLGMPNLLQICRSAGLPQSVCVRPANISPINHFKFVQDAWTGDGAGHQKFGECRSSESISTAPARAAGRSQTTQSGF